MYFCTNLLKEIRHRHLYIGSWKREIGRDEPGKAYLYDTHTTGVSKLVDS